MDEENATLEEPLNKNFREPKIRFPGYNGAIKTTQFKNIIKTIPSKNWIAEPNTEGDNPVIQQGLDPIAGWSDGDPFCNYSDILLFGDHTLSVYLPTSPFILATDGLKIIKPTREIISREFLRILIEKYGPKSEGYKRHFTILNNQYACFPLDKTEQSKISNLFVLLNELERTLDARMNALKKYKEGFVNNWFSTNKSNGCLGDVVHKVHTTLTISSCLDNTGDYPVYDANGDIIAYTNFYNNACDSIAIITRGSGCGRTFKTYGKHSVLGTMEELIVDNEKMYDYVYAFTKSSYFKRLCNERIERGAMPALYPEDYLSARLYIPNQSTIEKFTRMFNLLEEIESLTNKEENLLSSIKKQLLKDMFV